MNLMSKGILGLSTGTLFVALLIIVPATILDGCNGVSSNCGGCNLTICLSNLPPGTNIYKVNIKVGEGTSDEMNTVKNGGNFTGTALNMIVKNPADTANIWTFVNISCTDSYFLNGLDVFVYDSSCPSGYREYYLPTYKFWNNNLFGSSCFVTECINFNDLTDEGCF